MVMLAIVVIILLFAVGLVLWKDRPLDYHVTIEGIQERTQSSVLARVDGSYYIINKADEFSALFQFKDWKLVSTAPKGEPIFSLHLEELWTVDFYSDGSVAAHDGYTLGLRYRGSAYYTIPSNVPQDIVRYLEENGVLQELGEGA